MVRFLYDTEGAPAGGDSTSGEPSGNEAGETAGGDAEPKQQIFKEQLKKELRDHEALSDVQDFNDLTNRYISLKEQTADVNIPQSVDEYDFGEPVEGSEKDEEFEKAFRELAFNQKLSNDQAIGIATGLADVLEKRQDAREAETIAAGEKVMGDIGKDGKYRAEKFLKQYVPKEAEKILENPGAHEQLVRIAAEAGKLLSEDTLPSSTTEGGTGDWRDLSLKEQFPDMAEYFK